MDLSRSSPRPRSGRHLLRSATLARQLVLSAGIDRSHLAFEIGGGRGVLTSALAEQAGSVVTVELDAGDARALEHRFLDSDHVTVVQGDALSVPLPTVPFRVVANPPFHVTTALLHRLLDDPTTPLLRADLVVQLGAAVKRTRDRNLLNDLWGPWYRFETIRRLPRTCFRPPPSTDAAHLAIIRRRAPLVADADRDAYEDVLRRAFTPSCGPLVREIRGVVRPGDLGACGAHATATAVDLSVEQWAALFVRIARRVPTG